MPLLAPGQAAIGVHPEVAHAAVAVGARLRDEQQQRVHPLRVPDAAHHGEGFGRAVDPEIVAVDAEERLVAQQRLCLHQAAARLQQLRAFVGHGEFQPAPPRLEMRFDRVGEIMDIDHHLAHAAGLQPVERMIHQRLARHLDQRLGSRRGKRPHPLAKARRHQHRGVDHARALMPAQRPAAPDDAFRRGYSARTIGPPGRARDVQGRAPAGPTSAADRRDSAACRRASTGG